MGTFKFAKFILQKMKMGLSVPPHAVNHSDEESLLGARASVMILGTALVVPLD